MQKDAASLATVERTLNVLLSFGEEQSEWTITDLSARLGYSKSMVHRILRTLLRFDFIIQDPDTSRYKLGYALLRLADGVGGLDDLRLIAREPMSDLANATKKTCVLTVVDGLRAVSVHKVDNPERLRITLRVGFRSPLYAGASGKVLLAYLPPDKQEAVLREELVPLTDNTVRDVEELRVQLQQIRNQGYCQTNSELDAGLAAIAAPVYDHRNHVIAGLSIVGLSQSFAAQNASELREQVKKAAARISTKLGAALRSEADAEGDESELA